jgi:hypothetical protein
MERAWKEHVRPGLRDQEILDLHDYNDFHWSRTARFANLRAEILAGRYFPLRSVPVRVEKKQGVTRTLVLPSPEDSLVLQCIVEHLLPIALARQPSKNAFFSRSHGTQAPEMRFHKDYIWFRRWAQFSKLRFQISSAHDFICVTDIANYFDNIDYRHLRNMMSELDGVHEVTMDVLFLVLDAISWRPDYLPPPGRSLPQVNFDAPRLLSHLYLFEVDEFMQKRTSDSFVRWVDDMTIAADTLTDAKEILRDLDELLMTRGLRLNSGKTQILSARQARRFFQAAENSYLDNEKVKIGKFANQPKRLAFVQSRLQKRFSAFLKVQRYGHWDKVAKRYLSLFIKLKDAHALPYCLSALTDEPGQREAIWRYLAALPASTRTLRSISAYMLGEHALDDASVFHAARVLTEWQVKPNSPLHRSIRDLGIELSKAPKAQKSPYFFLASLWILAKYGLRKHLDALLVDNRTYWETSEFLSRQVAAVLPKFRNHSRGKELRRQLARRQFLSVASILQSLDAILDSAPKVSSYVILYILNGRNATRYSVQRFLICLHVLTSTKIGTAERKSLRLEVLKYVKDPLYVRVLNSITI